MILFLKNYANEILLLALAIRICINLLRNQKIDETLMLLANTYYSGLQNRQLASTHTPE